MNNDKKALKSGVWYLAANFLLKSIVFITTPIFSRLLTHEDFGLYNNYTSWLSTLTVIVTLNLDSTFIRARFEFEDKFDEFIFSVLTLSTLSGGIWLLLINLFPKAAASITGVDLYYVNLMIIYLIALPAVNMFQGRERYAYKYKASVAVSLIVSILTAVVSIVLVKSFQNRLAGRIIGSAAPTILIGFGLYCFLWRKGKRVNLSYWKYALPICLPFIPHLLSLSLLNSVDRIMITKICGPNDNALYSLAHTCGAIITLLVTSMNSAFSPWLGEKLNSDQIEDINRFSKKYILGFTALSVGIILLTPEVLLIMGGKSYLAALYVMPPVAFGCVCQFLYTMYVNIEQFKKKTVGMAFASASAALLNFILNWIFIPRFGYIAAAYTTLVSFLWLLIVHILLVKRMGYLKVYPIRTVILALLFMSVYTLAVNALYKLNYLRYAMILAYCTILLVFILKNKSKIVSLLKRRS